MFDSRVRINNDVIAEESYKKSENKVGSNDEFDRLVNTT